MNNPNYIGLWILEIGKIVTYSFVPNKKGVGILQKNHKKICMRLYFCVASHMLQWVIKV